MWIAEALWIFSQPPFFFCPDQSPWSTEDPFLGHDPPVEISLRSSTIIDFTVQTCVSEFIVLGKISDFGLVLVGSDTWSEFVEISFHRVDFQNLMFQYFNSHGAKREFLTLDVVLSANVCRAVVRTLLGNWKWRSNRPLIGQQSLTGRSCDRLTFWSVQCLTEASLFLYI